MVYFRATIGLVIGSVARGDAGAGGDLDLLVLTRSTRPLSQFYARLAHRADPRFNKSAAVRGQ
jgi:predicted nucleotidyltransferase